MRSLYFLKMKRIKRMKQSHFLFSYILLFLCFTAKAQESKKGQWTNEDLKKARNEMFSEREQLDDLIGTEKTNDFIVCTLQRVEQEYENFAEADDDVEGVEIIADICIDSSEKPTQKPSVKGLWNVGDYEKMYTELNSSKAEFEQIIGEEQTKSFINCAMERMENEFPNFEAANNNPEEMKAIGFDCMTSILENQTSSKGNWSITDRQKAREHLEALRPDLEEMLSPREANAVMFCAIEKAETQYNNFKEADHDYEGMKTIGRECMNEVLDATESMRGLWTQEDLQKAHDEMENEREEMDELIGAKNTDSFIECALSEVEMMFENYEEADNSMEGVEEIAEKCMAKILE